MKLTIYKIKQVDGETFRTPDIECEYNIEKLNISSRALKKLFKIISKEEFNAILAQLSNKNYLAVVSLLKDVVESDNDEIYYFIRHVLIESGYYLTCEQLLTAEPDDLVGLLTLMFRPYINKFGAINRFKQQINDTIEGNGENTN